MEDDWILLGEITPEDILPEFIDNVAQVSLFGKVKWKSRYDYSYRATWKKFLGMNLFKEYHFDRPLFTTAPGFVKREFARNCACLMNPDKDPEKQLYSEHTELGIFTTGFRNRVMRKGKNGPLIADLGRDWLANLGIKKHIVDGVCVWNKTD